MNSDKSVRRESGVRKYLKKSIWSRFYQWRIKRSLGESDSSSFIDANVEFQRHPGNVSLGKNVIIKEGSRICPTNSDAKIKIGDWTTVGHQSFLFATDEIEIGANCLIAPFCYLVDANHGIHKELLIREQPMSAKKITLGDDVWLGTSCVVLKGVSIGDGAVVSAGTVVVKDIPPYAIVSGNPAEITGHRK